MPTNFDEVVNRYDTYSSKWYSAKKMSEQLAGHPIDNWDYHNPDVVLPFMVADMDLACCEPIVRAMHKVADHRIYGYSGAYTEPKYVEALVHWYKKRYNFDIDPKWVHYSQGSVSAVNTAIKAFTNVGDGVILCRPVYGHFTGMVEGDTYRKVVNCQLINNDGYYTMDWDRFEEVCAVPTNRAFILCSPENPVGRVWTVEELQKMLEICRKNHVLVIADEIHGDIVMKGHQHHPILSVTDDYSNIIMISGINKSFNVAGLQCANTIIPDPDLRGIFMKEYSAGGGTPFAIAAQIAAYEEGGEWLDEALEYIEGNMDFVIDFAAKNMPKLKVRKPEGTYILWLDFSNYGISADEIHDRIYNKAKVLLQDGLVHDPDLGGCFQRMCMPAARCVVEEAMKRICKAFADLA